MACQPKPRRAKVGAVGPNLVEPGHPTLNSFKAVSWAKETLDLTELARLRWVERWSIKQLAAHLEVSSTAIKERLRRIRKNPRRGGLASCPPNIRIK